MEIHLEPNDLLYDESRNIILFMPGGCLWLTGEKSETLHLQYPIPLNAEILVKCCKFTNEGNGIFKKDDITIEYKLDMFYHINEYSFMYLHELQQLYRSEFSCEIQIKKEDLHKLL